MNIQIIYSLKTAIIATGILGCLVLNPQNVNAQEGVPDHFYGDQVLNPYVRPNNVSDWNYVGSMRNENGLIPEEEISEMGNGPYSYVLDLNGNGGFDKEDRDIYLEVLNGQRKYSPSDWNRLETVEERIDWLEKMIENYDDTKYYREGWSCGDYSNRFLLRFAGLENAENSPRFEYLKSTLDLSKENGKINLPVYTVYTTAKTGVSHIMNGIFIGSDDSGKDTPLNFDSWYFIEPQLTERVFPGDWSMDENSYAGIGRYSYIYNWIFDEMRHTEITPVDFLLDEGTPTVQWYFSTLITNRENSSTGISNYDFSSSNTAENFIYPNPYDASQGDLNIKSDNSGLETEVIVSACTKTFN